jgi:hypothetical protein
MINNPTNEHESPNQHSPQLTHSSHSPNLKSPHSSTRHFTTTRPFAPFPKSAQLTNSPPIKHKPGDPEHVHVHESTPIKDHLIGGTKTNKRKQKLKQTKQTKTNKKHPTNTRPHTTTHSNSIYLANFHSNQHKTNEPKQIRRKTRTLNFVESNKQFY